MLVKQMTPSQNRSSLLTYAISRLSPEVFSHPVWVRFGKKGVSGALKIVDDLFSAAKKLKGEDPGTACQVLLICAVYQNYAGQQFKALKTTQQALALAQQSNLFKETIWAIWGECAISVQQGNYEQTSDNLVDLQAVLSEHNEWVLADFVDVLRQSFSQPATVSTWQHSESPRDRTFEDVLGFTFDWLLHWGFSAQAFETEFNVNSEDSANRVAKHSALTQSFFSIQHWQGRWHHFLLAIRGELRLQWTENDSRPTKRQSSYWESLLSSLRVYLSSRKIDTQATDDIPQIPDRHAESS